MILSFLFQPTRESEWRDSDIMAEGVREEKENEYMFESDHGAS